MTSLDVGKCLRFEQLLNAGQCNAVMVGDIKLDILNGRVGNDSYQESKPWPRQQKKTGRLDRALLCDLGDYLYVYWFTGDEGRSCNNVGFAKTKPPPATPSPPLPVLFVPTETRVYFSDVVRSPVHLYQQRVTIDTFCAPNVSVPDFHFYIGDGDSLKSSGYGIITH